ncbi:hypothetical protein ColKHC_06625 [Colletotrichum higginsianum]|nr:hypothetical protein ColKHC_06625 [Colletotrichum higginsianum]
MPSPSSRPPAANPSVLPQRWPEVQRLLQELDPCLNHLAEGPGPNVADIYPSLRREFWRAAYLINADASFTAFLRARILDLRLQATLLPVFSSDLYSVRRDPVLQRFTKAAKDLG